MILAVGVPVRKCGIGSGLAMASYILEGDMPAEIDSSLVVRSERTRMLSRVAPL
jgi:hypothetical protein